MIFHHLTNYEAGSHDFSMLSFRWYLPVSVMSRVPLGTIGQPYRVSLWRPHRKPTHDEEYTVRPLDTYDSTVQHDTTRQYDPSPHPLIIVCALASDAVLQPGISIICISSHRQLSVGWLVKLSIYRAPSPTWIVSFRPLSPYAAVNTTRLPSQTQNLRSSLCVASFLCAYDGWRSIQSLTLACYTSSFHCF